MNILTIDLEDWFHILAHDQTTSPMQWEKFESRVERNTEWILEALTANHRTATFFCLGWIAKRHPGLIKKIASAGHEIACHSMNHQLVYLQNQEEFKKDIRESLDLLENITGLKIVTYRAPGFSITEKTKWAFEILLEAGIENDCSIFPIVRNHGGYADFPSPHPCIILVNGATLKEFPINLGNFLGKKIVFSGGGYFRLLPFTFIRSQMKKSEYVVTYFHPRDFDPDQPMLDSLPFKRKMMSYTGLRSSKTKFSQLIAQFTFVNIIDASTSINWQSVPVVKLD